MPPPQLKCAFARPLRNPARVVTTLKVEPGGNALTARLMSGFASSLRSVSQSFALMLGMKVFGSKDGTDAIARMFPLFGSITTAAPHPTARNASYEII